MYHVDRRLYKPKETLSTHPISPAHLSSPEDQDRFVSTDRDDLMDTFSQFLILDLEVPDDTPSMQTRMLAQVIFESQQMRSQGEMETIPLQPSWLMDSSVAMGAEEL
ncbi:hypothetical protein pdam_00015763 [Pocillopora damicornis]|uniref:Uncharacterized protein n=1 Tax=Pocillopora damicornis TaxID=46731 RepID=A0A3M6T6S4_POCDA|nr:hypothetical protein pdam_00015763 [Pocillopora damicornis]